MKSNSLVTLLFLSISSLISAQDLLAELDKEYADTTLYVMSTFKGTRVSIGHSIETRKKNTLEVSFMSRYWNVPQESSNSFIADRMCTRLGIDYGISDNFTVGAGTGNPNGIIDVYGKYRFIKQRSDGKGSPFGITAIQTATYRDRNVANVEQRNNFGDKLAFTTQLLIARKFSKNISFVSNHVSIVSEYYYVANPLKSIETFGAFSLGANWEVSKLLLQFKMTNNQIFTEDAFITQTLQNFNFRDGNFFFGFHATYHIQL